MAQNVSSNEVVPWEGNGKCNFGFSLSVTSDESLTLESWEVEKDPVMLVIVLINIPCQTLLCFLSEVMKTNTEYFCC